MPHSVLGQTRVTPQFDQTLVMLIISTGANWRQYFRMSKSGCTSTVAGLEAAAALGTEEFRNFYGDVGVESSYLSYFNCDVVRATL